MILISAEEIYDLLAPLVACTFHALTSTVAERVESTGFELIRSPADFRTTTKSGLDS